MIPQPKLDDLKRLIKAAAPPPVVVSPMDSRGQRFQLSTPRPGATVVGTAFKKADAELMAALWQWGALLIADLEQTIAVAKHYRDLVQGGDAKSTAPSASTGSPETATSASGQQSNSYPRGGDRTRRHSPGRVAST